MKKIYSIFDESNEIVKCEFFAEGQNPENSTELLANGQIKPVFDPVNNVIIEGATTEQIAVVKTPYYIEKLQLAVTDLRIRAKGLAIGKTGTNSYILAQVDFYQRKYENAISQNPVPEIDADLESEGMRDFELSLPDFKALIISMYNSGKEKENQLMSFIEQGRSAILTLISNNEWVKVNSAFEMIENLKGITTVDQARIIKNQILELC